jgi:hypothetical protein
MRTTPNTHTQTDRHTHTHTHTHTNTHTRIHAHMRALTSTTITRSAPASKACPMAHPKCRASFTYPAASSAAWLTCTQPRVRACVHERGVRGHACAFGSACGCVSVRVHITCLCMRVCYVCLLRVSAGAPTHSWVLHVPCTQSPVARCRHRLPRHARYGLHVTVLRDEQVVCAVRRHVPARMRTRGSACCKQKSV